MIPKLPSSVRYPQIPHTWLGYEKMSFFSHRIFIAPTAPAIEESVDYYGQVSSFNSFVAAYVVGFRLD